MVCTFFGHRECYGLEASVLQREIEKLILAGADTFYVGHQGHFDSMVFSCLKSLGELYPHISYAVVLAYLPLQSNANDPYRECSIYPAGVEIGPPRFAIERRNVWMIEQADLCLCYLTHKWGGAYRFVEKARKKGVTVIDLGSSENRKKEKK